MAAKSSRNQKQQTKSPIFKDPDENAYCMECGVIVKDNEQAVQCEDCNLWWHSKCADIPDSAYNFIASNVQFHWFCLQCNPYVDMKLQEGLDLLNIKERIEKLEIQGKNLSIPGSRPSGVVNKKILDLESEIQEHSNAIREISDKLECMKLEVNAQLKCQKEQMHAIADEIEDRHKRSMNLVIFNITESNAVEGTARQDEDRALVRELLNILKIESCTFDPVIRLGRYAPSRSRPIRITVPNIQLKLQIVNAAKAFSKNNSLIPDNRLKRAKIFPDKTITEREKLKANTEARRRNPEQVQNQRTFYSNRNSGSTRPSNDTSKRFDQDACGDWENLHRRNVSQTVNNPRVDGEEAVSEPLTQNSNLGAKGIALDAGNRAAVEHSSTTTLNVGATQESL